MHAQFQGLLVALAVDRRTDAQEMRSASSRVQRLLAVCTSRYRRMKEVFPQRNAGYGKAVFAVYNPETTSPFANRPVRKPGESFMPLLFPQTCVRLETPGDSSTCHTLNGQHCLSVTCAVQGKTPSAVLPRGVHSALCRRGQPCKPLG